MQTWDSAKSVWNYLSKGQRNTNMTTFKIRGTEITPPLINHYLTPEGSLYNATSFINPNGENPIELGVGIDADFIGDGEVDHLRLGGQYKNINIGKIKVSPFAYINAARSDLDYNGFSVGAEASLPLSKNIGLRGKMEYNKDDILENTVKGKDNGFNAVVGLEARI